MKISEKLYISTGFSVALILVIGLVVIIASAQITTAIRQDRAINEIARGIFELSSLTGDYLLSHNKRALRQWGLRYDSLAVLIRRDLFRTLENRALMMEIQTNHERSKIVFERLKRLHGDGSGDGKNGDHEAAELEERLTAHLLEISQIMISDVDRLMDNSHRQLEAVSGTVRVVVVLLVLVVATVATLGSLLISRSIIKPIAKLLEATEVIGAGNLDYRIGATGRDEIGELSRAFDRMTENLVSVTVSRDMLAGEIEQRKRAEARIKESERLYRGAIEAMGAVPYRLGYADNRIVFIGDGIQELTGYSKQEYDYEVWQSITQDVVSIGEYRDLSLNEAIQKHRKTRDKIWRADYLITTRSGEKKWVANASVNIVDSRGEIVGSLGSLRDITERKQAEEQIKTSLKEKEILLQEVHHRVKNNMQVISSLLALQKSMLQDEKARAAFEESQKRIRSMALVHTLLYRSKSLSSIHLDEYIQKLTDSLLQEDKAGFRLDIESIDIGIEQAIPCGLVINELITNSLKHAFAEGQSGEIEINGRMIGDEIEIVVADNGRGIPEDIDTENTKTLGLQLVRDLTEIQLKGTVEISRETGTRWTMRFRKES